MTDQESGVTSSAAGETGQGQAGESQQSLNQSQGNGAQGGQQGYQATQNLPGQGEGQGNEGETRTVPLSVLKSVKDELSQTKEALRTTQNDLNQVKTLQNMGGGFQHGGMNPFMQPMTPNVPANQPNTSGQGDQGNDVLNNLKDDDLINAKDLKTIVQAISKPPDFTQALKPVTDQIARLQVHLQDPNYEQTIRTYLPEMITAQPFLRAMIERAPNPIIAALTVAQMSPRYIQAQNQSQNQDGQTTAQTQDQTTEDPLTLLGKIIENATLPASPASMGAGGAVSGYDRFKNMSDVDFDAEVQKVINGL